MSFLAAAFAVVSLAIVFALVWLVMKPLPEETSLKPGTKIEELLCLHTQHFPQLRQTLASADSQYIRRKVSKEILQMWHKERRQILRGFLAGLAEDFARLDRLVRTVASLSPKFAKQEELERIWLSLRFRFNYRVAELRIFLGGFGMVGQLVRLTELLGSLSARAEAAMARVELSGTGRQTRSHFSV